MTKVPLHMAKGKKKSFPLLKFCFYTVIIREMELSLQDLPSTNNIINKTARNDQTTLGTSAEYVNDATCNVHYKITKIHKSNQIAEQCSVTPSTTCNPPPPPTRRGLRKRDASHFAGRTYVYLVMYHAVLFHPIPGIIDILLLI